MFKNLVDNKGITLVSLVVTIILLIILAGTTINLVLGENGIIKKARNAKASIEIADIISRIQLDILNYKIENNEEMSNSNLEIILSKYGEVIYDNDNIEKLITDEEEYEISIYDILGSINSSKSTYINDCVLYCWDWEQSLSSNSDEFMIMCDELNITSVYFCFDPQNWTTYKDDTKTFIRKLNNKGISILALSGDPSWTTNLSYIVTFTDTVINYNKTVNDTEKILGIVLDIEPAATAEWSQDEEATLKTYVETQKQIYSYAKNSDLLVIQCIPYWFEDISYEALEDLVQNACDGISVMNYWKNATIELISTEMQLAQKYNKYIDSIAEFGEPNGNVTDNISFYNDGIDAAKENWNSMKEVYKYNKFGVAYHHYAAINQMQGGTYPIEIYLNKDGKKVPNANIKVINVNRPNIDIHSATTTEGGYAVFWLTYGKTYEVEVEGYGIASITEDFSKQEFSYLKKDGDYFAIDTYIKDITTTTKYNAEIYFKDESNNLITNKEVTITNVNDSSEVHTATITEGGYISLWLKHGITYEISVQDYTVTSGTFSYEESVGNYKAFDVICK